MHSTPGIERPNVYSLNPLTLNSTAFGGECHIVEYCAYIHYTHGYSVSFTFSSTFGMLETKDEVMAAKVLNAFCSELAFKATMLAASSALRPSATFDWSFSLGSTAGKTYK